MADRGVHVTRRGNRCLEFVTKLYELVDDPSTDSLISWGPNGDTIIISNPLKCCRDIFPQYLGVRNFMRFLQYGFEMVEESRQLEYACDDFVKGQPELLDKIGQRYKDLQYENFGKHSEARLKRLRSCKTEKERESLTKENLKGYEVEMRAKMDQLLSKDVERLMQTVAYEREWRRKALPEHLEERLQLVLDSLNELTKASSDL
ncbi:hypothetical protein CARUB_v10007333mg [Capsella rubella]|uniref:HSF-type DNA-binding domain-containing protein n=1 Tax=Capsella rubella TaxID=81985 RepID=R0H257_9BRAS|nr:heat stress transcription factor A-4b isoform X1 [Capsella rubella]EOA18750.1 hypothetical protein CARUB_v10007333mg [Capsella rubella]